MNLDEVGVISEGVEVADRRGRRGRLGRLDHRGKVGVNLLPRRPPDSGLTTTDHQFRSSIFNQVSATPSRFDSNQSRTECRALAGIKSFVLLKLKIDCQRSADTSHPVETFDSDWLTDVSGLDKEAVRIGRDGAQFPIN